MNIFAVDSDPRQAAAALCDKHVVKMTLESAQLLCSPFEPGSAPYKRTHYNHPCAVWTRGSLGNYLWLVDHAFALANQFECRYGHRHASVEVIVWCHSSFRALHLPDLGLTPFAQAMPAAYRGNDSVAAYRRYYIGEKSNLATWRHPSEPPSWWGKKKE